MGAGRCALLSCRSAPSHRAATHRAARGRGRQLLSEGFPAPAVRPGPAPPSRPPGACTHAARALLTGEGGRRDGGSAILGHAAPQKKQQGGPSPPRTVGPGQAGRAGGSGRGSALGCAHRGAGRSRAHRTARRPSRGGEWRGRARQECDLPPGSLAVSCDGLVTFSEASVFQRFLTFVGILRLPQLPGCCSNDASEAPVFPSTFSSVAKNILTFFNISFLEEVLWI